MKRRHILLLGLALYAVSFVLVDDVGAGGDSGVGWASAFLALILPWGENLFGHGDIFQGKMFEWVALLISGWVNLVFLVAMLAKWRGENKWAFKILRAAVFAMIPFCWVVFYYEGLYPREGHFVWIVGMLLMLFSIEIGKAWATVGRPRALSPPAT